MTTQARRIAETIYPYQRLQFQYLNDASSRLLAQQTVESIVEKYLQTFPSRPLKFVFPGFPFKFPIRTMSGYKLKQKTLIDAADYFAIIQLEKFVKALCKVYKPGATLDIQMDSEGFKDLEKIPHEKISQYKRELEDLIKKLGLDQHIRLISFAALSPDEDFASFERRIPPTLRRPFKSGTNTSEDDFLRRYVGLYEYQRKQLQHLLKTEDKHLSAYLLARKSTLKNKLKLTAKEAAYRHLRLQDTWRQIIEEHFPDHIRLSSHPQLPDAGKIGICLSDKANLFAPVPWQGVPLRIATGPQTYIDTVVDYYNEILTVNETVRLRYIYFDRIGRALPCYTCEIPQYNALGETAIDRPVRYPLLRRTGSLFSSSIE